MEKKKSIDQHPKLRSRLATVRVAKVSSAVHRRLWMAPGRVTLVWFQPVCVSPDRIQRRRMHPIWSCFFPIPVSTRDVRHVYLWKGISLPLSSFNSGAAAIAQ